MKRLFFSLITFSALAGCEVYDNDPYQKYYLVEAYLFGNEPLTPVYLSTTAPLNIVYRFDETAVSGASVSVSLLALNNPQQVESVFPYTMVRPGVYEPAAGTTHRVLPKRTYRLDVSRLSNPEVQASVISGFTTIPDTLSILRLGYESQRTRPVYLPGTVVPITYQQNDQILTDISVGAYTEGRSQHFYIFTIIADDTARSNLTPFYADVLEPNEISQVARNESGIINQKNYIQNADNSISVSFPWIAVAFFGKNRIVLNSIDNNYYDFRRSQQVQLGGGTVSPGEINNPIYHLEGAIGVFGSLSRAEFQIDVAKPAFLPKNR